MSESEDYKNEYEELSARQASKRLTTKEIRTGCIVANDSHEAERLCVINHEFEQAFEFIKEFPKSVSFFGSARCNLDDPYYKMTRHLASRIVSELGYAVVTGGGPGIMGAANKGAFEAGGPSIGLTITLPFEQASNRYLTHQLNFYYFFSRKVTLSYSAEAYIFMPGGFGTLDECFEILTLVQTNKIDRVPIIMYGSEYWNPLDKFIKEILLKENQTISPEDIDLYTITDDEDVVMEIVKNAPIREAD